MGPTISNSTFIAQAHLMTLYDAHFPQLLKMLGNLDAWLAEAQESAKARGFDAERLSAAYLAPDQFDLCRNVQAACDTVKLAGARLSGASAPVHEDGPASLDDLRSRIAEVRSFVADLDKDAINAQADTVLTPAFLQGRGVVAREYMQSFAAPNTYFHMTMVYAILRHNGVALGKRAYLGSMETVAVND